MAIFDIQTEHGKITVEIKVTQDPIFNKLGLPADQVERALQAVIMQQIVQIGGTFKRPVKWDN